MFHHNRPIGWTEWDDIFCGHSWVAWGSSRLKKLNFKEFFFSLGNAGTLASFIIIIVFLLNYLPNTVNKYLVTNISKKHIFRGKKKKK